MKEAGGAILKKDLGRTSSSNPASSTGESMTRADNESATAGSLDERFAFKVWSSRRKSKNCAVSPGGEGAQCNRHPYRNQKPAYLS